MEQSGEFKKCSMYILRVLQWIIRGCHNRGKGTAENERFRNPKFIFSYPRNERRIFLNRENAAKKEISTKRAG